MTRLRMLAVVVAGSSVLTGLACSSSSDQPNDQPPSSPSSSATPGQLSDADLIRLYEAANAPRPPRRRVFPRQRQSGDPTTAQLRRLRWCESGRDDSAGVDSRERARGFYKFMRGTWMRVGGHGDPARASYAEQTMRAVLLYRREGWTPWLASSSCTGLK